MRGSGCRGTGRKGEKGTSNSRSGHNDKGKGGDLLNESKIALVSSNDRGPDLAAGERDEAVIDQPKTAANVVAITLLQGPQYGALHQRC